MFIFNSNSILPTVWATSIETTEYSKQNIISILCIYVAQVQKLFE